MWSPNGKVSRNENNVESKNFAKSQYNDANWWINHLIILYFPNDSQSRLTIEPVTGTRPVLHFTVLLLR